MRLRPGTVGAAPAWRRNQRAVTATAALLFFGGTLATPFLPLWMHDISGGGRRGDLYAGIALSVTPLLASAMGPVWARLALSTTVPAFLSARGLLGIAAGGLATFAYAAVAARIPPRGRTASLGTLQSVAMLGGALGPLLASGVAAAAGIAAALWVPAGLFALVLLGALAAPHASARFTLRGEAARAEGEGDGAVRGPPRPPGEGSR